ncbi:MAG: prolipoprotein diacylglyceryl transferase, partial [Candidatus Peribacteraceae bacterium]|nr:prolipoprotein diacylglyceryl transferase [Candidatus Peribacteraceae bacterium]
MFSLFPSRTVAIELFGWAIHWYGILYLCAFLLAFVLLPRLQRFRHLALSTDDWSAVLTACILGVLLGGRIGYVLFYEPLYYLRHPLQVFAVWNGGMSSHGGFAGVGIALLWVVRRRRIPLLALLDVLVIPAAIGLALGRIGNLINGELFGTVTLLPWGVQFPGVPGIRHPVQLYAVIKDLLLALVCMAHLRRWQAPPHGRTFALFLILYAVLRFAVEYFRAQQYPVWEVGWLALSRGQMLTIPLFLFGVAVWVWI